MIDEILTIWQGVNLLKVIVNAAYSLASTGRIRGLKAGSS